MPKGSTDGQVDPLDALGGLSGLDALGGLDGLEAEPAGQVERLEQKDGIDVAPQIDVAAGAELKPGAYEQQANEEVRQVEDALGKARREGNARIAASNDYDYFAVVVFTSVAQRDAFLAASKWDTFGKRYIDGLSLAESMGIVLPDSPYKPPRREGPDPAWKQFHLGEGE